MTPKHLVLLHGWAMHSGIWGDFAVQLSRRYRVTFVNLPLHDNLEKIGDAIIAELKDDKPFYLLGWSLGGTVALDIAARYSNRVQGVILMAANPCFVATETWAGMPLETFNAFTEQFHTTPIATLQRFLSLQLQGQSKFLKEVKARFTLKTAPNLFGLETSLTLLKTSDLRPVLEKLTCPISAILSDNDTLIPVSVGQKMQTLQPNLQLTILKNASHIPFVTQPENCLNIIYAFLNDA